MAMLALAARPQARLPSATHPRLARPAPPPSARAPCRRECPAPAPRLPPSRAPTAPSRSRRHQRGMAAITEGELPEGLTPSSAGDLVRGMEPGDLQIGGWLRSTAAGWGGAEAADFVFAGLGLPSGTDPRAIRYNATQGMIGAVREGLARFPGGSGVLAALLGSSLPEEAVTPAELGVLACRLLTRRWTFKTWATGPASARLSMEGAGHAAAVADLVRAVKVEAGGADPHAWPPEDVAAFITALYSTDEWMYESSARLIIAERLFHPYSKEDFVPMATALIEATTMDGITSGGKRAALQKDLAELQARMVYQDAAAVKERMIVNAEGKTLRLRITPQLPKIEVMEVEREESGQ